MKQYVVIGTYFTKVKVAKVVFAENTSDAIVQAITHERNEGSGAHFTMVEVIDTYGELATVGESDSEESE